MKRLYLLIFCLLLTHNEVLISSSNDVFIAIPLTSTGLAPLRIQLIALQKQIKEKAAEKGFLFDISKMPAQKLHITLETVKGISDSDTESYKKCIQQIASTSKAFDISSQVKSARLEIMGKNKDWCVLKIPASGKTPLVQLNQRIRWHFEQQNLSVSEFEKFNAHISLGRFIQDSTHIRPTDLKWASSCHLEQVKDGCKVKKVEITFRDRIKKDGTIKLIPSKTESLPFNNEVNTPAIPILKTTSPQPTRTEQPHLSNP